MTTVEYVIYELATGKIIGGGSGAYPDELNVPIPGRPPRTDRDLIGSGGEDTHYVDVSNPDEPALLPRPIVTGLSESYAAVTGEEVTITEVPACDFEVSGPISGSYQHPGGPLVVGFTVPGDYTISADPWPHLAFSVSLKVSEK